VFAPGLYTLWGIPKTPLVLGLGGSFAPKYRRVTLSVNDEPQSFEESAFHLGAILAVDVPFVVISRGARKK
jgi:hypothetical protein